MGCVFDDNSQNNIMSDIDKHHGDSYSCDVQEQQSQLSQKLVAAAIAQWVKNGMIVQHSSEKKMFVLNEIFQRNTSKVVIFLE